MIFIHEYWSKISDQKVLLLPSGATFFIKLNNLNILYYETVKQGWDIWFSSCVIATKNRMPWFITKVRPRDPSCVAWYTHMDALCWYVSVSTMQKKSWQKIGFDRFPKFKSKGIEFEVGDKFLFRQLTGLLIRQSCQACSSKPLARYYNENKLQRPSRRSEEMKKSKNRSSQKFKNKRFNPNLQFW
jgi:hypothetical protein